MTEKEFKKLKPGDKVKIVSKWMKSDDGRIRWSRFGAMDGYLGKKMTVMDAKGEYVSMREDGGRWYWFPEMIERKGVSVGQIKYIISGRKTVIKLPDGRTGVAWRNPEDKDDPYIGAAVALARAFGREFDVEGEQELVFHQDLRKVFKFGDRVRIKSFASVRTEVLGIGREEWDKLSKDEGIVILVCDDGFARVAFSNGKIGYIQLEYLIKEEEA